MKKEFRFKENKVVTITQNIGITIFILGFLSLIIIPILSIFITNLDLGIGLLCFLISMILAMPFIIIGTIFSKQNKFTKDFIDEIKLDLSKAVTTDDLYKVRKKLFNEAVEDGLIRLSYPLEIKNLMNEIHWKINILNKLSNP
jgi:hypothetical protein